MYIPALFENKSIEELQGFIERYNFATLVVGKNGEIEVSHVPMMLDRTKSKYGLLYWHLAKQNKQSLLLNGENNAIFIFHGPHAYISPSWYKTHPNVPTWNYAVVHAHGIPKKITQEQLCDDLDRFVDHHESLLKTDKKYLVHEDYKKKLINHIEGFHMEITQLEGKFKLGQNRSSEDQQSMASELLTQHDNHAALDLAKFILDNKFSQK